MQSRSSFRIALGTAIAIMLVAAPAAHALYVKGHQVPDGTSGVKYKMTGGLKGKWKITNFHVKHERRHLLKIKGTERFVGCVDVARDGSCAGDPGGKLYFRSTTGSSSATTARTSCWARAPTASSIPPTGSLEPPAS
jgi:hypothetical protein